MPKNKKPLKVGETFISAGNRQGKQMNYEITHHRYGLPVLPRKVGNSDYFQHGNPLNKAQWLADHLILFVASGKI
jgi:hypothetical protein